MNRLLRTRMAGGVGGEVNSLLDPIIRHPTPMTLIIAGFFSACAVPLEPA